MFCSNCGAKNEEGTKFCVNCGANLEEKVENTANQEPETVAAQEPVATQEATPVQETAEFVEAAPEKKVDVKKIITTVVIVAVVAAIAFFAIKLIGGLFGGNDDEIDYSKHPLLYVKDGDVMANPAGKKTAYEIGETDEVSNFKVTEDGKGIFYAADYEGGEYDLYYRKSADMKGESKKIDSGVTYFTIVPETHKVVYLKDDKLIYHDLKNEITIDKDVEDIYFISKDGKMVFYTDDEGTTFASKLAKNAKPEEIGENVSILSSAYEDYNTIYFTEEDKLYKKQLGKKEEKIANDVYSAFELDGKVFVVQADEKEYKFDDLFINDMKDEMENAVEPNGLPYPFRSDFETLEDYEAAREAYDEAWETWYKVDGLRDIEEEYNENPEKITSYSIHEVKGKELKKIDENIVSLGWGVDKAKAYYKNAGGEGFDKIKLSELESSWSASSEVYNRLYSDDSKRDLYLVTSEGKHFLAIENAKNIEDYDFSEDGKTLYVFEKKDDKEEGELKSYKIGASKLSGEKVVAEDVAEYEIYDGGEIAIENKDGETSLIIGKKIVDLGEDVRSLSYEKGIFFFLADYSDKSATGDLSYCENGKVKKIADDVYSYRVFSEKRIAYIGDFDDDDRCGTLYIGGKSGKAKVIDDEVERILW